jgi:uncharacterized protein (TIGR00252 family)
VSTEQTPGQQPCSSQQCGCSGLTSSDLGELTVAQLRELAQTLDEADTSAWALLETDSRAGVRQLAARQRRAMARAAAEEARQESLLRFERRYWGRGLTGVAGVDEVGRGCLAGPVVAAAVVLPPEARLPGLDDSKKLSPQRRELLNQQIRAMALGVGIGQVESGRIDQINILQASLEAMRAAVACLPEPPEQVLVDGRVSPGTGLPEVAIIGGDSRSLTVAAASVVAKVHRDLLMVAEDRAYPEYGFAANKGYGSAQHLEALRLSGPCVLHRRSFAPVAQVLAGPPEPEAGEFRDQLRQCRTAHELAQLGEMIGLRAASMGDASVQLLRGEYRQARARLERVGNRGEELAARYLESHGYTVEDRRYRAVGGEIDLIVSRDGGLVFVEVKTSAGRQLGRPEERVDSDKRARLRRTAQHYLERHSVCDAACRFDVIAIELEGGEPRVEHLEDAFHA